MEIYQVNSQAFSANHWSPYRTLNILFGDKRFSFHVRRRCYASYLGAVSADDKPMQTYLGQSAITITKDLHTRCRHSAKMGQKASRDLALIPRVL